MPKKGRQDKSVLLILEKLMIIVKTEEKLERAHLQTSVLDLTSFEHLVLLR